MWRMLKLRENGLNIDYIYETNSVLRKTAETEISDLTFWLRFGSVFINRNRTEIRFPHIPSYKSCKAPVKSSPTNSFFTGQMPFLSPNQQCWSTEGRISHSLDLFTPSSHGVFQLYLWPLVAPGYLGGGLPCLSSALWYPCTVKLYECKCVVTKYPCRSCLSNGWDWIFPSTSVEYIMVRA